MKAYVNVLILFGFTTLTYSQEKNTGPMNMENLPFLVIKVLEMTFQYTCLMKCGP
jgi:hypothetical protein